MFCKLFLLIFVYKDKLKFQKEVICKNRRSFFRKAKGKNVTSIQFIDNSHFLVSTNDSRMRLINLNTLKTVYKYKGNVNQMLNIVPDFEEDQ